MKFFSILIFLFISNFVVFAQKDSVSLQAIIDKTERIATDYPQEKVYLHFDKPYYTVADTIWLKAYLVQPKNIPSTLSKIVYVDLFNSQDSLLTTLKLPVNNAVAYGNLALSPDVYKQGNYYVKAYTNWMMNFNENYFFTKNIVISEAIGKKVLTYVTYNTSPDGQKIIAKISYKTLDGKPYVNRNVKWQFINHADVVTSGNDKTDMNGFVTIGLNVKQNTLINDKSVLQTQINYADKEDATGLNFNLATAIKANDIQFFPEGGDLIEGVPTQVAVKAINSRGLGVGASGVIMDSKHIKVADFKTNSLGMGVVFINAEPNNSYKAEVNFMDGSSKTVDLPQVKPMGITLQVNNNNENFVRVKVLANETYYHQNKDRAYYLLAQNAGNVYFAAEAKLQNQFFTTKIAKSKLPMGVVQFTLFSDTAEPLSERLVFINNKAKLNLTINADKPTYTTKQRVKFTIQAKDSVQVALANLSLSVTDESKVPIDENREITILSSLLLSSDLQGYIEKPNYYFYQPSEKKNADLDLLMLTQGYRRFSFKEILNNKYPEIALMPEQGLNITGTLRTAVGTPINKGTLLLSIPDLHYNQQLQTTSMGVFNFKNLFFNDSTKVTLNAKYNPNSQNIMIMIDGSPAPAPTFNKQKADEVLNIDTALNRYIINGQKQYRFLHTLNEVKVVAAKEKKPSHRDYSSLSTLSIPEHEFPADRFNACNLLLECLKYSLTGVTYFEGNFYVSRDYNQGKKTPMQVFLNGMPVDVTAINTVEYKDLSSVEVFLTDPLGTVNRLYGTNGAVVINTKVVKKMQGQKLTREEIENLLPKNNIITFSPMGYTKQREFYTPKYTVANGNVPDLRTTIYWNPKIVTDTNGQATVEFFNADGKGSYKAVLEGVDTNGNVGRTTFRYQVK